MANKLEISFKTGSRDFGKAGEGIWTLCRQQELSKKFSLSSEAVR